MAKKNAAWGFDIRELEPKIRPQDDFFHHVHTRWIKENPIPAAEPQWGTFTELRLTVEKQVRAIVTSLETTRKLSPEGALVRDLYRSGMDMKRRNALGIRPLSEERARIDRIRDRDSLLAVIARLHRIGVSAIWGIGVDQDMKNTDAYALYLGQAGLGMPDRDYYLKTDAESKRVRDAYQAHVEKLFRLMGESRAEAACSCDIVLGIETALAEASMAKEDLRNPEKIYHKHSRTALQKLAPQIDWQAYLSRAGAANAPYFLVMQPEFFRSAGGLIESVPLDEWKTYLTFHLVNAYAGSLSAPFQRQAFAFYGRVLTGATAMKPLWRRVLASVNGSLGEALGKLYVEKHFPPEAKRKMDLLVDDLFTAYEARLRSVTWMGAATKRKALQKLATFTRKIGYPRRWRSYTGLRISPNDFVGNLMRVQEFEHRRHMRRLGRPIDRDEWLMFPQTVNAYYQPTMNDIVFPAAILQPPIFSVDADDALNYGGIGMVIGHEITHGFDDEGSKFDAKGNLKSWWTPEDRTRFMAKAKKVEKQFNAYEVEGGLRVNGKLTLGENIADLGGLSIAFDAYQLQLARTGRHDIDGLTPEQRFFLGFSMFQREHARPEATKTQVLTDPHSPSRFRINGPVSNFDGFYSAYQVTKGDRHYRAPKDRETVW